MKPFLLLYLFFAYAYGDNSRNLAGTYSRSSGFAGIVLQLRENGWFKVQYSTCIINSEADGHWYMNKDTLILNTKFANHSLPITVKEQYTGQGYTTITLPGGWPQLESNMSSLDLVYKDSTDNIPGYIVGKRIIVPNGLLKFAVWFEQQGSELYSITNSHADNFIVTADTSGIYSDYVYMVNRKLLVRDGYLYPLNENNRFDSFNVDLHDTIPQRAVVRYKKED